MFSVVWNSLFFILAIGILVAVHEWGHFWVARRCGVKVIRFSIGFGKPLWRTTDKTGTEYVIAAIPLGGYVKMLDDRVESVNLEDSAECFNKQPVLNRIAIVAAGPIINLLFAALVLCIMYMIGVETVRPHVGTLVPNSIVASQMQQQGKLDGAQILSINQRTVEDWEDVNLELISSIGEPQLHFLFKSASGTNLNMRLDITSWQFDPDKQSTIRSLGIQPFRPAVTNELAFISEDSPAQAIGLQKGDKILGLNGTPMQTWTQIVEHIGDRPNQAITVELIRNHEMMVLQGQLGSRKVNINGYETHQGYLGVVPLSEPWPESQQITQRYSLVNALFKALKKTWRLITLSFEMIGKLVVGDLSVKNLSGPISIAQGAGTSASYGVVYFLSFLALISVNLGIINLLPLPVLDGGHLMYYFVELFTGRPVSEQVQQIGYAIGASALFVLMSIALFNDFARL
jgi:regulator of sigma E protease